MGLLQKVCLARPTRSLTPVGQGHLKVTQVTTQGIRQDREEVMGAVRTERGVLQAGAKLHLGLTRPTYCSNKYSLNTYCKPCMVAATVNKTLTRLRFGGAQSKNSAPQKQGAVCGL